MSRGGKEDIKLVLKGYVQSSPGASSALYVLVAFILIAAAITTWFFLKIKQIPTKAEPKIKEDSKALVKDAVMKALDETESKVLQFIMDEKEKSGKEDFYLNQARIVYGAGIPKTTVIRNLRSLESKGFVRVERQGKMKKISLNEHLLYK